MWSAILGPLLVHDGDTLVEVPKGRQRVLLAAGRPCHSEVGSNRVDTARHRWARTIIMPYS
jgi:hypothetical protein